MAVAGVRSPAPRGRRSGRRSRGRSARPDRRSATRRWRRRRTISSTAGRRAGPGSRTSRTTRARPARSAPSGPLSPAYQRSAAWSRPSTESTRSRPSPTSRATSRSSRAVVRVERLVTDEVAGHQPGVVLVDRHQVAGAEVALADPVLPRHPGRARRSASSPGSSTTSLTVTCFCRGARAIVTRPAPADVARAGCWRRGG